MFLSVGAPCITSGAGLGRERKLRLDPLPHRLLALCPQSRGKCSHFDHAPRPLGRSCSSTLISKVQQYACGIDLRPPTRAVTLVELASHGLSWASARQP